MRLPLPGVSSHAGIGVLGAVRTKAARGILLMVLATACITGMHALVRHLSREIHPFEIAFFRNLVVPLFLAPWIIRVGLHSLRTRSLGLHLLRSGIGVIALLCWFMGLSLMPLAEATALNFSSTIFTTIGAAVLLRERVRRHRWAAVAIGFAGAIVILRPGAEVIGIGAVLVLASSIFWAGSLLYAKILTKHDSTVCIVAYMAIFSALFSCVPAALVWQQPTPSQFTLMLAIGAMGTIGYLLLTQAFKEADATVVIPLDFLRLIWASLIGYALFSEIPDLQTWIGGGMIVAGATYIALREAHLKRLRKDAAGR